jgi:hypothetical protein
MIGFKARARVILLGIAIAALAGCASGPIPPVYTQDEQRARCESHSGWWHADDLVGGFCENNSQM